jgi:hypothetical protein
VGWVGWTASAGLAGRTNERTNERNEEKSERHGEENARRLPLQKSTVTMKNVCQRYVVGSKAYSPRRA